LAVSTPYICFLSSHTNFSKKKEKKHKGTKKRNRKKNYKDRLKKSNKAFAFQIASINYNPQSPSLSLIPAQKK
jgi:hypothetical protein